MATKKFRTMSLTNRASTERLIQNRVSIFVSMNETSTGVTTAVYSSSMSVTMSHRRM